MRSRLLLLVLSLLLALPALALADDAADAEAESAPAPAPLQSMSTLAFAPGGVLLVGDAKGAAVYAIETGDVTPGEEAERFGLADLETKIGAMVGARATEVLIHDMAVNPASHQIYFAVSRGRGGWDWRWELPNDVADATILVRVGTDGEIEEVPLEGLAWSRAELPDPIDPDKEHRFKQGVMQRTDTITDLAFEDGTVWVAGLSNEEFASTLWRLDYPFASDAEAATGDTPSRKTTVEIFHGAHGEWETHSPIRTFVPYSFGGKSQLLAAYLCTPLVTFETENLADGAHVKGRTLGEFGSGNYPLDMVLYQREGEDRLMIANSNLPLMIVDPADIESFDGAITEEVEGYTGGVPYEIRSGAGIQQLDVLDDGHLVALQRLPGGTLDLVTMDVRRY